MQGNESQRAGRRWQIVWQGPRLGFVAEHGSFVTIDALTTIFLLFFRTASFYSSFFPSLLWDDMFPFFVLLRLCSIHLLLFSKHVFFSCHLPCLIIIFKKIYVYVFVCLFFLGWRVCALVAGTRSLDLLTLINSRIFVSFFSLSRRLWPPNLCISLGWRIRMDTQLPGVLLTSLGRKNGLLMWRQPPYSKYSIQQ